MDSTALVTLREWRFESVSTLYTSINTLSLSFSPPFNNVCVVVYELIEVFRERLKVWRIGYKTLITTWLTPTMKVASRDARITILRQNPKSLEPLIMWTTQLELKANDTESRQ